MSVIDHIEIPVNNANASLSFYEKALAPLGFRLIITQPPGKTRTRGFRHGLGPDGYPRLWLHDNVKTPTPLHIAFSADERSMVDQFWKQALLAGGQDNGAPGIRPNYHAGYYAAYVLDPDGNNVEVVCQADPVISPRPVSKQVLQPPQLFSSRPWGFSQVVISEPGRIVSIAGQVAWDASGRTNAEGLEGQFRQVLKQIFIAVESAGGSSGDIQNLRIYVPDLNPGRDADVLAKVLVETFGTINPPASSWIGVQALAQPEYMVEVEALAVIPVK